MARKEEQEGGVVLSSRLLGLILIGLTLVFIGIAIIILATVFSGSSSIGGVILIGPVPILFGAGSESGYLIIIAAVLTIISILLFLIVNRRVKRTG